MVVALVCVGAFPTSFMHAPRTQSLPKIQTSDPFGSSPLRKAPYVAVALLIAIVHLGSWWMGDHALHRASQVLPAFPGFGVDLVLILVFGNRFWPVLAAVYFATSLGRHVPWLPSLGVATAAMIRTLAGVWLARWISGMNKALGHFEDLVALVVVSTVAPVPAAVLGTTSLIAGGAFPASQWAALFAQWWAADALGVLTLSPILIETARLWTPGRPKLNPAAIARASLFLAGVAGACYLVFFRAEASYLLFSVFLLILIAAAWLGNTAARAVAFVITLAAVRATSSGVGAFAGGTLHENLQNLALFLAAVSLTGVAVGAFRAIGSLALPGAVLLAGWVLSGWLYASMDRERIHDDAARLDQVVTPVETRIQNRAKTYEDVLWGAAGLVAASERVSPRDWHTYVTRLRLFDRYPETTAISVVQPVPDRELESFVQTERRAGLPDFAIHRVNGPTAPDPAAEHFLVICSEPSAVAARALGADLAGDPSRSAAAQRSRDTGIASLTRAMVLGDGRKGLQLFIPVYREGAPASASADRRAALVAWVTVAFRTDTFFRSALGDQQGMIGLRAYDSERATTGTEVFAFGAGPGSPGQPERITRLQLAGNTWTLAWSRLPGFPQPSRAPIGWAAGCTALLSLLIGALVITLQSNKRRTSDRLKLIQSASTLGTWEWDALSGTAQCSAPLLRLYGINEFRERFSLDEWLRHVHPDDRQAMAAAIGARVASHESFDCQYRVVWIDGSIHWLHRRALRVFDFGRVSRVVGVDFDISEIKQLQSQLAQAQKLESVGALATGVAHEINTPIQYIGDNGKFLQDAFADLIRVSNKEHTDDGLIEYLRNEVPKALEQLLEGVDQVARIVRAMKEFSHPGPVEKCAIDLNRAIESTILISRNEWKYVAEVTTDLAKNLPPVPCVAGEFNQAILNLIVNAAHAISDVVKDTGRKGTIHVRTQLKDSSVEISVADTGCGIPEAILSKVFDPFFTTKPVGKGTGQGLAIARSVIVNKHNGAITVDSEPGRGTTFTIELPLACELEAV